MTSHFPGLLHGLHLGIYVFIIAIFFHFSVLFFISHFKRLGYSKRSVYSIWSVYPLDTNLPTFLISNIVICLYLFYICCYYKWIIGMCLLVRSLITLIKFNISIRYFPRYEYEFVANGSFHLQKNPSLFHFSFLSFSH